MRLPTLGAKYQTVIVQVKNADTVVIPNGTPVAFVFNGTDDGLAVVLPATAGAAKATSLFAGVVEFAGSTGLPVSSVGDAFFFGMVTNAVVELVTRSATSAAWPSYAALAVGDLMAVDTINNVFTDIATGASSAFLAFAIVASVVPSATTQVSTSTTASLSAYNASTVLETRIKAFIRAM